MPTVREVDIRPLDLILFRGVDPVSKAIRFVERKELGHGDFSHAGIAVTREALDLPFLEPGHVYVWESTLSAPEGFWARFTDRVPDAETEGVRFGVQLRDLELVIPGYEADGGGVSWVPYVGERPPLEEARAKLEALHEEYGHAPYDANLLDLFGVVFPALRGARDRVDRLEDGASRVANRLLARAGKQPEVQDAEHHVFCSEWVALVLHRLGMTDVDPRVAAPVSPLSLPEKYGEPVPLQADASDAEAVDEKKK